MTSNLPLELQMSPLSEKILPRHLQRLAVVYVRQSTVRQVMDHRESTHLQYGLANRAVALGWPEQRVLVIDEDLGKSATSAAGWRPASRSPRGAGSSGQMSKRRKGSGNCGLCR